jgi:hypothetical protein
LCLHIHRRVMTTAFIELIVRNELKRIEQQFKSQRDAEAWVCKMSNNPTFVMGGNAQFAVWKGN